MTDHSVNLGKIAEPVREAVGRFVEVIGQLAGSKTRGLTVYGPAVTADFDAARHAVSSVLVLDAVDLDLLRRFATEGARLGKERISAPLVMTPTYIAESCDTFPVELLEIQQHHVTVLGDDFFNDLTFESQHVRLQCEREFKRILIRLRQGILAAAGREKMLADLETDIGVHLLRTLRGFLWLKDQKEYQAPSSVVDAVEKLADRKLASVRQAVEATFDHNWSAYESLYRDVEVLAGWANEA
ncbi:MAG: hypothetical protein IH988_07235 [Planctomycetes bacterium]|nr:hypothetical protein [Planctomycetota bacterium]